MKLTKEEIEFLIELINEYANNYSIYDNVYRNEKGELSELDFNHREIHEGLDIDKYKIISSLLDKLY